MNTDTDTRQDRTNEYNAFREARAYVKRYSAPHKAPAKQATRDKLAAAREIVKRYQTEFASLPAVIPSNEPIRGYDGRKVYRALAAKLDERGPRANHDRLKLRYETTLYRDYAYSRDAESRPDICIRYHATDVVRVSPNGTITLNHKGWTTNATADRINNDFLRPFMRAAGFPHYIDVGGAYLPDSALVDGGASSWYVHVHDSAARYVRREARYYPPKERVRRGGYERGPAPGYAYTWNPDLEVTYKEQGALRDFRIIESRGDAAIHYPFPDSGFTIGPRGHIRSFAEIAKDKRLQAKRDTARRKEQARLRAEADARDAIEWERRAALPDTEYAREMGWTPIPAETRLYKVLDSAPALRTEDATIAGRAPYQTAFVWRHGEEYHVEGVLRRCGNALHAATREQLPQWYGGNYGDADVSTKVVYTFVPEAPVFSAQGKCFTRAARLGRRLAYAEVVALLATDSQ